MNKLYVEVFSDKENFYTTVESFLVIYVYNYLECPENTSLIYTLRSCTSIEGKIKLNSSILKTNTSDLEENASTLIHLKLPVYASENKYISGLCAVCRELIKQTKNPNRKNLLGFKGSCLLSPSENSVWTKFCEMDIISSVNQILTYDFRNLSTENYKIPEAISRFEAHMSQPVRVHNIYKVIHDEARKVQQQNLEINGKENEIKDDQIQSGTVEEPFILYHKFAEGYFFTLADVILFPCFTLLFYLLPHKEKIQQMLPLTFKWLNQVLIHEKTCAELFYQIAAKTSTQSANDFSYIKDDFNKASLYKRHKPKERIFTKQENIEESLLKLSFLHLVISSDNNSELCTSFDWSALKANAFPNFGDIPCTRLERKRQQLQNLASSVIALAKDNDLIVDFCSGSGHLGILLAVALPKCHIILLENKAHSLARAQQRVKQMNLKNCSFYQSNIDYLEGAFDIGVSLHACGTATDIVLQHCVRNRAKFVCCPCCYGAINPMPHISYPLSKKYKSVLSEKEYLCIAHAADQSHNLQNTICNTEKSLQGEFCMDVIDTDRKLMAEEAGYNVTLTRLNPESCTTKNRLLIGKIL